MINQVFEFNDQVIGVGPRSLNPLTEKEADWTVKAFVEETTEFRDAYKQQDIIGMVDSCLDLCYFAIGTLRRMGLDAEQAEACFNAIHNANMTKKKGKVEARGDFADDAVKPAEFVPPNIAIGKILFDGGAEQPI